MGALPWICRASPRETNDENHEAGDEEKDAAEVELLECLPPRLVLVQLVELRRMIKELIQCERQNLEDDSNVVAPSPSFRCVQNERASDDGAEDCER